MLSDRDRKRLEGVHPNLVSLVVDAIDLLPKRYPGLTAFVIYGVRTREEQYAIWLECHDKDGTRNDNPWKTNFNGTPKGEKTPEGSPGTGMSRHQSGMAVDLGVNHNGKLTWDEQYYDKLANVMLEVSAKARVPLVWGGTFTQKDRPHFELNRKFYP